MKYLIEKTLNNMLKEKGIKQKYLCEKLGISEALLRKSMNCKRKIKATELASICFFLGIDLNIFKNLES